MSSRNDTDKRRRGDADGDEAAERRAAGKGFWDWLSSTKLAIVLLVVLALTSLIGTLVPQQSMRGGTDESIRHLYEHKYGTVFGGLMLRLSFHRLYGSAWYVALLLLLTANTTACATKSVRRAARRAKLPSPATTRARVEQMRAAASGATKLPPQKACDQAAEALRQLGYATAHNESRDGARCLVGRKWAWSSWASPVMHFSLVLIALGAVIGRLPWTSTDSYLMLEEGETYHGANPQDTRYMQKDHGLPEGIFDFDLTLDKFDMEFYPSGGISEYTSQATARKDGEVLAEKAISVNHPLKAKGMSFFQSSWGLSTLVLGVKAPDGTVQYLEFPLEQTQDDMGRRAWEVQRMFLAELPSAGWMVFVHNFWQHYGLHSPDGTLKAATREPESGETPLNLSQFPQNPAARAFVIPASGGDFAPLGTLFRDKRVTHEGYEFWIADVREWSGLSVRRDLGIPFLYAGFVLIVISMMIALYVAPRTVRVHLSERKARTEVLMGGAARPSASFDREFASLKAALSED